MKDNGLKRELVCLLKKPQGKGKTKNVENFCLF